MEPAPEGGVDVARDQVVVAGRASHRIDGASNVFVFDLATLFTGKVVIHGDEILPQFGLHNQHPTQEKGRSQADWLVPRRGRSASWTPNVLVTNRGQRQSRSAGFQPNATNIRVSGVDVAENRQFNPNGIV